MRTLDHTTISRFCKALYGIALKKVPKEECPSFITFLLETFYEHIGSTTFECRKGIKSIGGIVEEVKAKYEVSSSQALNV